MARPNPIKTKMSVTKITGYHCANCKVDTVIYGADEPAPVECINCKSPNPDKSWQDQVTSTTTVETLPLA